MIKLISTVIFLLIVGIAFSQKIPEKDKITNLRIELLDSIQSLKQVSVTYQKEIQKENEDLIKNLDEAANTISYLNSVTSTFSNIITFLGILIGIIALVVPFATYQYAVKPSKEALRDLEKYFDNRLEQYLWDNRNKQIDNAILKIKDGSPEEQNQAISYLTFTQSEGLTDAQLFQIYNIIKKNNFAINIKSQLVFILSSRKTDYASELFNSKVINEDPVIKQMAMIYFAKTGYKNNYDGIIHFLSSNEDQEINFNTLIGNLNQYNTSDINDLLNDSKIVDTLTEETLKKLKVSLPSIIKAYNITFDLDGSYLDEKIKTNA
ncbi:MAG: hypothetical protein RL264_2830 [Bacteroidota bacterium]|jgi:hypothetical protein